jgi:uncharacterized damage-inducible protein DinB
MKEILSLMAMYNSEVNKELYKLLADQDPALLTRESGSYFHNILTILNHILVSDLSWLSAYRDSNKTFPALDSELLNFEHPGFAKNLYENFSELRSFREKVDELFIGFVEETEDFEKEVILTRKREGKTVEYPVILGKALMHVFNHQSHHRGAISQILDHEEVENDYSNLFRFLLK